MRVKQRMGSHPRPLALQRSFSTPFSVAYVTQPYSDHRRPVFETPQGEAGPRLDLRVTLAGLFRPFPFVATV